MEPEVDLYGSPVRLMVSGEEISIGAFLDEAHRQYGNSVMEALINWGHEHDLVCYEDWDDDE